MFSLSKVVCALPLKGGILTIQLLPPPTLVLCPARDSKVVLGKVVSKLSTAVVHHQYGNQLIVVESINGRRGVTKHFGGWSHRTLGIEPLPP